MTKIQCQSSSANIYCQLNIKQLRYPANVVQKTSKDTIIALSKVTAWTTAMF